tara:strand:+ start:5777 stop:6001 length:225 start_codon:yes stop_codon:yes gene_type:complete
MWPKIIILILFILVLISLTSGLTFLLKDIDAGQSKRTLYALGIRITLATLLMATIFYYIQTGVLHSTAPWDTRV